MVADDRLMMSQSLWKKNSLSRTCFRGPTHKIWPDFEGGSINTVGNISPANAAH